LAGAPALFLDRDGVVNKEYEYVHRKEDFHFIPGVFAACRAARAGGYKLVIITNQAGIARGFYSEDDFHALTRWMLAQFSRHGIEIDGVYFCPHHPTAGVGQYLAECECRKPKPGLIMQAARELDIDLPRSALVGDKPSDIEAGVRAGVGTCILVRSGHSFADQDEEGAEEVVADLPAAIGYLLSGKKNIADRDQDQ
jgi:D-glycero-D-manno-heptose 1,7-bisphosphate phosphatase